MAQPPARVAGKFRAMELRVVAPGLRPLLVAAERSDTVLELKRRVHALLGRVAQRTPAHTLRLRVAAAAPPATATAPAAAPQPGSWLDNRRTLGVSGVRPGVTLELVVPARVTIHPLGAGANIEVWGDRFAPLADVRAQLDRRAGARSLPGGPTDPPPWLPLRHNGRLLEDGRTLAAYRLGHGAMLSVVVPAPASSRFCAARAALAELVHAALAGVDEAVSRPTPPLPPGSSAAAYAEAAARFGAAAASEQARALADAHAALGGALDALIPLRRTDTALRAELTELAAADAAAAAELRRAAGRARALVSAARAGLGALAAYAPLPAAHTPAP